MSLGSVNRGLTRALEGLLAITLFAIFAVIVTLVILRYFFGLGLVGANESATIAFVYVSSIGAALAVGKDEHIRVEYVVEMSSSAGQRLIHGISIVLVGFLNAVIFERSMEWIGVTGNYLMPATQLPRVVAQLSIPIGCSIAVFYSIVRLLSLLRREETA